MQESMQLGSRTLEARPAVCTAQLRLGFVGKRRKVLLGGYVSFRSRELDFSEVRTFQNLPLLIQVEEAFCDI